MKLHKLFFLAIAAFFSTHCCYSQGIAQVFDKETPITWLGLDFSRAKFIGDRERFGSESDMRRLVEAWNNFFLKEPDKFNVGKALGKLNVKTSLELTNEQNMQQDVLAMYTDDATQAVHLTPAQVEEVVSGYNFSGQSGIGFIFIVESFSKFKEEGAAWAAFIKLDSGEVIFSERITGKPGGIGLKNYWANAVHDMLERIRSKEFKNWQKKYVGKK